MIFSKNHRKLAEVEMEKERLEKQILILKKSLEDKEERIKELEQNPVIMTWDDLKYIQKADLLKDYLKEKSTKVIGVVLVRLNPNVAMEVLREFDNQTQEEIMQAFVTYNPKDFEAMELFKVLNELQTLFSTEELVMNYMR